jgi:hypothetical protein
MSRIRCAFPAFGFEIEQKSAASGKLLGGEDDPL